MHPGFGDLAKLRVTQYAFYDLHEHNTKSAHITVKLKVHEHEKFTNFVESGIRRGVNNRKHYTFVKFFSLIASVNMFPVEVVLSMRKLYEQKNVPNKKREGMKGGVNPHLRRCMHAHWIKKQ